MPIERKGTRWLVGTYGRLRLLLSSHRLIRRPWNPSGSDRNCKEFDSVGCAHSLIFETFNESLTEDF